MKKFMFVFVFLGINLFALSKQAQVDVLKIKIQENIKSSNYKDMVTNIKEWKSLVSDVPLTLYYWEGKAYKEIKKYKNSYKALEMYINNSNQGKYYNDAIKLLIEIEPTYKAIIKREEIVKKRKTELFEKVVKDPKTNLMWQDDYDVVSLHITSKEANRYCKDLNLLGFDNWHLPNANEIMTIFDFSNKSRVRKKEFKAINRYSHIRHNNPNTIYTVDELSGTIVKYHFKKASLRCVRKMDREEL